MTRKPEPPPTQDFIYSRISQLERKIHDISGELGKRFSQEERRQASEYRTQMMLLTESFLKL